MRRVRLVSVLFALAVPATAGAEIMRCAGADGRVTYQETPCAGDAAERKMAIPDEFPAPNQAERDRILARDADVDRRLQAERDRWQQDAARRAAAEERELERARIAAIETQNAQQYAIAYPYWRPRVAPRSQSRVTTTLTR